MKKQKTADHAAKIYRSGVIPYEPKSEQIRFKKMTSMVGSNNKVLDLGCYDGTLGEILINNNNEVFGIEGSKDVAEIARQKGITVKIQDLEDSFGFKANFFDVIVAGEVIEHILDTDYFIEHVKRVLKPNGFLVLSTPNVASFGRRFLLLFGKNPYFEASFGFPPEAHSGHLRFFTKSLLLNYLEREGFEIIRFTSDVVCFTPSGEIASKLFADLIPTFGRSLIVKAKLVK